ncbi:MAG: sulfatase family protein [Planctomycetota bacterium]|jgi:N-sulfoglucosamine sulfohydrolase
MNRREFLIGLALLFFVLAILGMPGAARAGDKGSLNILVITLDDLGWDSLGVTGCKIPNISPHIDRLASEGMMFKHAHIMTSICGPSRAALLTGRYPHCSGSMGHGQQPPPDWIPPKTRTPSISTYLHGLDYLTGCILKGSRQFDKTFDVYYAEKAFGVGFEDRDPETFYQRTIQFLNQAKQEKKPFFLYANPIDPHNPWPRTKQEAEMCKKWSEDHPPPAAKTQYDPEEVDVPAVLPDLPGVRAYIAPYYDAVHRGDECVGKILEALKDSGFEDDTLVFFLSDNGMGVPGAKGDNYYSSTKTPLIVRWPGVVGKGRIDDKHVVSSIDIVPTILEAAGLPALKAVEGRSLVGILKGKSPSDWRESVYAAFNYYSQPDWQNFYPVRVMTSKRYTYIWNSYTQKENPHRRFILSNHPLIKLMERHSEEYPRLGQRAEALKHRPPEEFYDVGKDPGCWDNLIASQRHQGRIERLRKALLREMAATGDPELADFRRYIINKK